MKVTQGGERETMETRNSILDEVDQLAKRYQGEELERHVDYLEVMGRVSKYMNKYGIESIEIRQPEEETRGE